MAYMNTSGQSGTGVSTYNDLSDKPTINGQTLSGNLTLAQIGAVTGQDIATIQQDAASAKSSVAQLQTRVDTALQQSTADALYLGKTAQAADSAKLGGSLPGAFATAAQGAKADTAYQKPAPGIPKSALDSAAQASITKADTAYQKPVGGIPKTDLDSVVQTTLSNVDAALQSRLSVDPRTVNGYLELYVSPSGNDTTGDGSSAKPFKTMAKVADYYNSLIGISSVAIRLYPGTYVIGASVVEFIVRGSLLLTSTTNNLTDVILSIDGGFLKMKSGIVSITYLTVNSTKTYADTIVINSLVDLLLGLVINGGNRGIRLARGGGGLISGVTINNCDYAVTSEGSTFWVTSISGSGNGVAFYAHGGIICLAESNTNIAASARSLETEGGRVFVGGSA